MGKDMYSTMLGDIEILGDPAVVLAEGGGESFAVRYKDKEFNNAYFTNLGVSGRQVIPAAATPVQGTIVAITPPNIQEPYKALSVTISSAVAEFLLMNKINIGSTVLLNGRPITAAMFSEVSLNNKVRWKTAQTGQAYEIDMENADDTEPHEPRLSFTGIRLS